MTETYEAITKVNETFSETFKNGDAKGVADLYTEEGQLLPANSDFLTGRTAVQGFFQGLMDAGIHSIQLTTKEVEEFRSLRYFRATDNILPRTTLPTWLLPL